MIVYRLTTSAHATELSGKGAELAGGRWNSKGIPLLYTSESRALCMVEVAVHIPFGYLPKDYVIISLDVPEDSMKILTSTDLPSGWKSDPPSPSTRQIGDRFVMDGIHMMLKVPSVVVQDEHNYLLNPKHKDYSRVKVLTINPFVFDSRFFNR